MVLIPLDILSHIVLSLFRTNLIIRFWLYHSILGPTLSSQINFSSIFYLLLSIFIHFMILLINIHNVYVFIFFHLILLYLPNTNQCYHICVILNNTSSLVILHSSFQLFYLTHCLPIGVSFLQFFGCGFNAHTMPL